jgi:hypothetical protein
VDTIEEAAAPPTREEPRDSVTELLEQLGRQMSALVYYEAQLAASRHKPQLRRAARDVAAGLGVVIALLTAFALANAAAVDALSQKWPVWVSALVLAAAWTVVGVALALALRARLRRVTGLEKKSLEQARAEAEEAVRATLERLSPALSREVASAALPMASGMAGGVVDSGEDLIEDADEMVESLTEDLPGGGVVNQIWDLVLMPGRFGVRVATTVINRGSPSS